MSARASNRSRRHRRARRKPMAEINVTPFVDVMLVLLIVFMVAAPMLTVGVPLDLPRTAAQPVPNEPEEPLTISIPAQGPIMLMETEVTDTELLDRLRPLADARNGARIFLRADGAVSYARVMQVMGALNGAGYANLVLVTDTGGPAMGGQD